MPQTGRQIAVRSLCIRQTNETLAIRRSECVLHRGERGHQPALLGGGLHRRYFLVARLGEVLGALLLSEVPLGRRLFGRSLGGRRHVHLLVIERVHEKLVVRVVARGQRHDHVESLLGALSVLLQLFEVRTALLLRLQSRHHVRGRVLLVAPSHRLVQLPLYCSVLRQPWVVRIL
jgi:hypothetical protein